MEDWWQNCYGAFFNMHALDTLPDDHTEIALLIAALCDIFEKHVVPHVSRSDGFTSNTNSHFSP